MTGIAWIYALPSISAIAIKAVLVWYGRDQLFSADRWVWLFLGGLLGTNVFELLLFLLTENPSSSVAFGVLTSYYMTAVVASAGYLAISAKLSGATSRIVRVFIFGCIAFGLLVLLIPSGAISGVESIGYSLTRVAGPFYWVLQVVIPGCWLVGQGMLLYTATQGTRWVERRRALALLIASCPLVLCIVAVMILMQMGLRINATIVISLAINVLLAALIYTEYESGIFRFLSFVPKTHEHQMIWNAARAAYDVSSYGLSGAATLFEKMVIDDALKKAKGNKTRAANMLGISRTTLRRKLSGCDSAEEHSPVSDSFL